ncbi:MAG TPA: holo-ACP synthase [Phycisphaerae bacterium]|nr:holo-ACP synthase [Phycisphaerae bacterium]HNU46032.1 holo-ACP synthase [Phycisphaerae bacterium]
MTDLRHGIDLVECARIARMLAKHGERFLERVLTPAERAQAARHKDPTQFVAGRWAAKEAILKMIGTGWRGQIAWTDMEVLPDALGQPLVTLHGETAAVAARLGLSDVRVSITHTRQHAAAVAIAVG